MSYSIGEIHFYDANSFSSYSDAIKRDGLKVISHDYLDMPTGFDCGIAADIREFILIGAGAVLKQAPNIRFFLFDHNGKLIDNR